MVGATPLTDATNTHVFTYALKTPNAATNIYWIIDPIMNVKSDG